MFAVVRTGGKQYRIAAGDKIVVDRIDGDAGARVSLGDVLFASEGATAGLSIAAEIIAQAKADKITVFKKKRRHNYRRKAGHRQQHTILRILSVGKEEKAKAAPKADAAPKPAVEAKAAPKAAPKPKTAAKPAPAASDAVAAKPVKKAAVKKAPAAKPEGKAKAATPKKPAAKKPVAPKE